MSCGKTTFRRFVGPPTLLAFLVLILGMPVDARGDQQTPKPVVMLLMDTSGSMEYSTEALITEGEVPTCHDSAQVGFSYERSRWVASIEVLTGSFNDYWCSYDFRDDDTSREDYMYAIPHILPHGTELDGSEQRQDGLLDLYRDSIKFGLMGFDSSFDTSSNSNGGYSYGPNSQWSGFSVNLGARNSSAPWAKLVAPASEDGLNLMRLTNDVVQEQIVLSKPYSGTPMAPLLEDAGYFFEHDHSVKECPGNSESNCDPYSDCRSKNIILITDGQPSLGEGNYGYQYSDAAAADLLAMGVKVHVVGFQMPASTFPVLDEIALAGGTEQAYIANDQAQLVSTLGEILTGIEGNQPSRVGTAFTNRTLNLEDKQYQFNASYSGTSESPLDFVGHLDQLVFRCDEACQSQNSNGGAALCGSYSISNALNQRTTARTIYTQLDGALVPFSPSNTEITADLLDIPTSGFLAQLDPEVLSEGQKVFSGLLLGDGSDPAIREEYRQQLIKLVAALPDSRRESIKMGAIYHSDPVIQPNLFNVQSTIPSFTAYRNQDVIRTRPTVLFVGTHDAQMHAFRVDRLSSLAESDYGLELWSFLPKHLLGDLNQLSNGMAYLLDGSPVIKEIRMYKDSPQVLLEDEVERWKSVLVSGDRHGGRGYFALDVTDPTTPDFMWEVSNTELCNNVDGAGAGCYANTDLARLGYSYSTPAVGTVYFQNQGSYEERAVAIMGGGGSVSGDDESGLAVFVVNLETGAVIKEFCDECGNVEDGSTTHGANHKLLDCPMISSVAAYDEELGGNITRAFVGDSCGQLWRLDLSSPNPSNWVLRLFHDAYDPVSLNNPHRRGVFLEPSLVTGNVRGRLVILYGTGGDESVLNPAWADRVYSVSEFWNGTEFEAKVEWALTLEAGERFTNAPLAFDQVAYFTTQTAGSGACDLGVGRLWGLDFDGLLDNTDDDLIPMLDEDGDPLTTTLVNYLEYAGSDLAGLQIIQRPGCFETPGSYAPWLDGADGGSSPPPAGTSAAGSPYGSSSSGSNQMQFSGASAGALQIVMQTGNTGVSSPELTPPNQVPGGGGSDPGAALSGVMNTGNKAIKEIEAPSQTIFSVSWGLIFD